MSYTPIYKSDTPLFNCSFLTDDNAVPNGWSSISLSDISMHFVDKNGVHRTGTGTWSNLSTTNGTADYRASAADTGVAGPNLMYPVVQFNAGPEHFDAVSILIIDLP